MLEEALTHACETLYEGERTRVLRSEHLVAICLQTGRGKDRDRVRLFREEGTLDLEFLAGVLARHDLAGKWNEWTTSMA
ncbi:MAG: hypothetical protein H0V56_05090 [Chthoniobacterales bacterium]|nr:hypothetical protein [Chthoniobacterales bacterium]